MNKFCVHLRSSIIFQMILFLYLQNETFATTQTKIKQIGPKVQQNIKQKNNNDKTYANLLTKQQIIDDINYVLKSIKGTHVSTINGFSEDIINQTNIEISNLKDKVSINDEWRIISRILHHLKDAHTMIDAPDGLDKTFPFNVKYDKSLNNFVVTDGKFTNYEIASINDTTINTLYETFKKHFSYEIEERVSSCFFKKNPLNETKLILCGINVAAPLKIVLKSGKITKVQKIKLVPLQKQTCVNPWVSYSFDMDNRIGIFTLDNCIFNEEYKSSVDTFFDEVRKNNINNIILDLRNNNGGDSRVANYFLSYFKINDPLYRNRVDIREGNTIKHYEEHSISMNNIDINTYDVMNSKAFYNGNIYVLTSNSTFSSAVMFANIISDNKIGKIIGEVPGNAPTAFGDIKYFDIPNSKLKFCTTYKKFYRLDMTKNQERLIPDVQVDSENAMQKAYEVIKNS